MNKSIKFWNRIAKKYSNKPIADQKTYQKKLDITQSYFKPEMNILEFGCGTGSTAIKHAKHVNTVLATDLSDEMIKIANQRANEAHVDNIIYQSCSIEELKLDNQSMDAVLALSILHLLEKPQQALAKTHKMLKAEGLFFSSTVCIGHMNFIMKFVLKMAHKIGLVPYINFLSVSELKQQIIDTGFKIEKLWQSDKSKSVFIVARKG